MIRRNITCEIYGLSKDRNDCYTCTKIKDCYLLKAMIKMGAESLEMSQFKFLEGCPIHSNLPETTLKFKWNVNI